MSLMDKIIATLKSLCLTFYYILRLIFIRSVIKSEKHGFVVSLTSYGPRVKFAFLTIESIFNQACKPDKIILWLYKNDRPHGIWLKILKYQEKRGLTVRYLDRDVRSYKKLSFVLDDASVVNDINFIVTADDDVFYPYDWLQRFKEYHEDNKPAVLCYRARNIIINEHGTILPYRNWSLASKEKMSEYTILPTGVSGICYPIQALDKSISAFDEIDEICPYADDIWYKMVTTKNNFSSKLVVEKSVHFTPVFTGFTKGLEKFNVLNELNDKQFQASMKYFNLKNDSFLPKQDD